MKRQTGFSVNDLIVKAERVLNATDEFSRCSFSDDVPIGLLLNEIGFCAVSENDLAAQNFLSDVLLDRREGFRYVAYCYLKKTNPAPDSVNYFALVQFESDKRNKKIVADALEALGN
jgi:hypothetical protein